MFLDFRCGGKLCFFLLRFFESEEEIRFWFDEKKYQVERFGVLALGIRVLELGVRRRAPLRNYWARHKVAPLFDGDILSRCNFVSWIGGELDFSLREVILD